MAKKRRSISVATALTAGGSSHFRLHDTVMTLSSPFNTRYPTALREIEQAEDQAQRLVQLRERFGIEEGKPLSFPL